MMTRITIHTKGTMVFDVPTDALEAAEARYKAGEIDLHEVATVAKHGDVVDVESTVAEVTWEGK